MTLLEQIQKEVKALPLEKQTEALDFVIFLQQRSAVTTQVKLRSLSAHPVFGSWRGRDVDALKYQQEIRSEWDNLDGKGNDNDRNFS
jgi:hypothetical protein